MAKSLVLVLLLLLLESTIGTLPFQQCCPGDDEHAFNQRDQICNSNRTLGLECKIKKSEMIALFNDGHNVYWLRESDGVAIVGSKDFGMVIAHESFCVANITSEATFRNGRDGIVFCNDTEISDTYLGPEPFTYAVCFLISGTGCFLTFLAYILVPEQREDLLSKCLTCALFCYMFSYFIFGITLIKLHWMPRHCVYQALFMLFWLTTSAFWTNVISFDIWRSVVFKHFPINEAQLLKLYYFWGWGMPLVLTTVAVILEALSIDNRISFLICQIESVYTLLVMVVPCLFLLFFNLLYFIWTIYKLWGQEVPSSIRLKVTSFQNLQYKSHLYLKLFLMMGIPWIIYLVATVIPGNAFTWMMLNSLTILQGLFVFLLLVVFQKKALLGLAEQFTKWGHSCLFPLMLLLHYMKKKMVKMTLKLQKVKEVETNTQQAFTA